MTDAHGASVYLTFDDGPDKEYTPLILDLLAAARIKATFFMIGELACRFPELVRRVQAQGHRIGNHSYSHRHPWFVTAARARREVADGSAAIADIIGERPGLFRPPHGAVRRAMAEESERLGEAMVLWDLSAIDWGPKGTAAGIAGRLARVKAGDIVLMHDSARGINRPDVLVGVLPQLFHHIEEGGLSPAPIPLKG